MMQSPFDLPPHPFAQSAAKEVITRVHVYMDAHPDSELHRQGKMFGVLVYSTERSLNSAYSYIAAFSAMLDGSYHHEGFVPPVYEPETMPIGTNREDSRRRQRLLFANYRLPNGKGKIKNLLEIFADEKPILSKEEFFDKSSSKNRKLSADEAIPPSGAGECCAPKLLHYALTNGLEPVALAEFWVGAPPKNEIRQEGVFYTPCSGRCVPILRHMLQGVDVQTISQEKDKPQAQIVYEDEYLIVVNKPAGLLSVPGKTYEPSVESSLKAHAVHRLDQDTSGLLVLAKTSEVYSSLQAYFQRRDILKRYEAVVKSEGVNELMNEGEIELPLLPNPYDRPRQMVDKEHGKVAITRYTVRERRADGTLFVDFFPLTGRTHQLRVHAAHPEGLNAPIVGDRLYGIAGERLKLHAAEIQFVHPITGKEMHFCIPSNF